MNDEEYFDYFRKCPGIGPPDYENDEGQDYLWACEDVQECRGLDAIKNVWATVKKYIPKRDRRAVLSEITKSFIDMAPFSEISTNDWHVELESVVDDSRWRRKL